MSKSVEKFEDKCSDKSSGEEGKITLSLCHLDSDHFLGSDKSEEESIVQSMRTSIYAPRPLTRQSPRPSTRQSPRESVQSSRLPFKKKISRGKSKKGQSRG